MKKLSFLLTFPFSLLCPPIESIKGLSSQIRSEFQHLSPINAMVALETGQLKRLLQTGDPEKPSTKLLEHLFKIQDNRLYPQNNLSRPSAFFNPEMIATLVAALEKRTLMTPSYKETWQSTLLASINQELKKRTTGKMTAKKLGEFLEILKQAVIECKTVTTGSIPALPYMSLLGYLCLKYKSVDDLIDFFRHLYANRIDVFIDHTGIPELVRDHFILEDRQRFERDVYESLSQHSASELIGRIKRDRSLYETVLFTHIDSIYYRGVLPPMAKESDVNFDGLHVRDCVNTAIRTFFDHLFYDAETFTFNPRKKIPRAIIPCEGLLAFYEKYSRPSDVNGSSTIAYDWMKLLANRPDVIYHREDKQIEVCARGGMRNILIILNQLFNLDNKTWEDICTLLSTEQRTLSHSYERRGENESLTLRFDEVVNNPYTLTLELRHEHGFMQRCASITTTTCTAYQTSLRHGLLELLVSDTAYDLDTHNLLAIYMNHNPEDLREDIKNFIANRKIPYVNLIDFYSLFDFDVEGVDLILFESICSKLRDYPQLKHLLKSLIFELSDDTFYYYYNIKYLAKYKVWQIDAEFISTIIDLLGKINDETYLQKAFKILGKYQAYKVPALYEIIEKKRAPVLSRALI
jgi:hypothetical protein